MKKDRFAAFFDAIMAIILTIGVLGFAQPQGANWSDLGELGIQVLTYALSFFWLCVLWVNVHALWHDVEIITKGVMWTNLVMLFFASMIPFLTIYVGNNIGEVVPLSLYAADVIIVSVFNQISNELLWKQNLSIKAAVESNRISAIIGVIIIGVGLVLGITVFPSAIIIAIFVKSVYALVSYIIMKKHIKITR